MKKLLIVGGGYADIPLIQSAQRMGYHVITTGNRPEELGHYYSDEYHKVDFSDCDAVLRLAKKLNVAAICSSCNDFAALSAAYTAEHLGLAGHDTYKIAQIIHHKDKYRSFASANDIPTPTARGFSQSDKALKGIEEFNFPVIIKPVDLTGGKGISVVNKIKEAQAAIEKAFSISKAKRIVIEEFITGTRHGFSAFLYKGKVCFYFSDNEHYYINPYMVSAASTPSIVSKAVVQNLCEQSEKIASLLSLVDGILHIQFILRGNEPVIIEICRRAPGDLYVKLVEYATGVDYPGWIVKASAGIDCFELKQTDTRGFFTRHCIMSANPGKVQDIIFDRSIENNIIEKFMWWKKGDHINDVKTSKFGIVFFKFGSMDEMIFKTKNLNKLIKVITE